MKLHENNSEHLSDFIRLNEQWICRYFALEEADRKLAENPQRVIDQGGSIFTLTSEGCVVGGCALLYQSPGIYELAKMAVDPEFQGQGLSHLLMKAALEKAQQLQAQKVILLTNSQLKAALALYQKHGFVTTFAGPHAAYQRVDIVMEKIL